MAKICLDCRRHALIVDPADESDSIYFCPAHRLLLSPPRLNGPACSRATFAADFSPPAPRRHIVSSAGPRRRSN